MSSLQQLFTTQFDTNAIKQARPMDGKAFLYKRAQSVQWQVRFKLANDKWLSKTINTTDIKQAKVNAIAIIEKVKIKTDAGLAITTKTFKQIALDEITNISFPIWRLRNRKYYNRDAR